MSKKLTAQIQANIKQNLTKEGRVIGNKGKRRVNKINVTRESNVLEERSMSTNLKGESQVKDSKCNSQDNAPYRWHQRT